MLDEAIRQSDNRASGKFVVHDALNARDVELTPRQIELIRRIQSGELHFHLFFLCNSASNGTVGDAFLVLVKTHVYSHAFMFSQPPS